MKEIYVLCCNDSLKEAYLDVKKAIKEAKRRQKIDGKDSPKYWHIHTVEVKDAKREICKGKVCDYFK